MCVVTRGARTRMCVCVCVYVCVCVRRHFGSSLLAPPDLMTMMAPLVLGKFRKSDLSDGTYLAFDETYLLADDHAGHRLPTENKLLQRQDSFSKTRGDALQCYNCGGEIGSATIPPMLCRGCGFLFCHWCMSSAELCRTCEDDFWRGLFGPGTWCATGERKGEGRQVSRNRSCMKDSGDQLEFLAQRFTRTSNMYDHCKSSRTPSRRSQTWVHLPHVNTPRHRSASLLLRCPIGNRGQVESARRMRRSGLVL